MSAVLQSDHRFHAPPGESRTSIGQPDLGFFLNYWSMRRGDRQLPARADIDPIDIPQFLSNIGLVEVEQRPRRYRYRLVGSFIIAMCGENFQGRYLDEAQYGPYRTLLETLYGTATDNRRPVLSEAVFHYDSEQPLTIRRLILPLAQDDEAPVNIILFANEFVAPDLPERSTALFHFHEEAPFRLGCLRSIEETFLKTLPID